MANIIIDDFIDESVEIAERKGIGHPDTICDEITEQISIALCRYYLEEFGAVMHHNIDKALLIGGQSEPTFKGGRLTQPISLIIAGRATSQVNDNFIPVDEIAIETAKKWLGKTFRHLDLSRDIQIISKIRPGSTDLVDLFKRIGEGQIPLANDTSFGAGYYPTTYLENALISIEKLLNDPATKIKFPFIGEDIKVMGIREHSGHSFTIAIAMIDKYIANLDDYILKVEKVKHFLAENMNLANATFDINTADDYERNSIYLTVTGTSAESGDDGQVGRGNRVNGLITPYKPMSLEATSGKNPVNHTGKIYNYLARDLSREVVENNCADSARVFIVSQIGHPIDKPKVLHFQLKNWNSNRDMIIDLAKQKLNDLPNYWNQIIYDKVNSKGG